MTPSVYTTALSILYMLVATRNWWPGRKQVLVSTRMDQRGESGPTPPRGLRRHEQWGGGGVCGGVK